ncbi:MAG: sulfotransferase, partial [Nanoarchaeota archaeon]
MKLKEKIKEILVYFLIGRDFQLIDKLLFKFSNGTYSGWVLGNKLRAFDYGKSKYMSKEPFVFIGGFPRSGTTLLRAILEQHPDIAGPGIEVFPFQELHDKWRLKEGFEISEKEMKELEIYKKDVVLYTEKV